MTVRSKAYFLAGQPVTTNPKFRTNNKPTELTFTDLFDSIPFKAETADTASESVHGLVKVATGTEVLARTNTRSSYQLVVKPSHLPAVGNTAEVGSTIKGQTLLNGIQTTLMQEPDGRLKYLIDLLIHSDFFKIRSGGSEELTMSDSFVTSWNALLELIDGGSPNVELADFPSGVFDDGGIVNNGGVFTVDTDDSTMHIDPVTKKVQIKDGGVTLDKLQNLNAGEIIVAPTGGGTPEVISLLGVGKILVGTATGLEVKDINDYLLSISISDNSIKARKLDPGTLGDGITKDMAASDASKLKVNLSAAASLEFDNGALQLKGDEASPSNKHYYGTGPNSGGIPGYHPLYKNCEVITVGKSTGVGVTTTTIDVASDILTGDLSNLIFAGEVICKVHEITGSAPDTYQDVLTAIAEYVCPVGETYIETINISGLTAEKDYGITFIFHRRPTII